VSATGGLTSAEFEDAQLKHASIEAATKRVLVATGAKISQASNFRFGTISDLTHLITTIDANQDMLAAIRAENVHVTVV
jgi:DeoR/GlpR family transcriptional regulator of sugar metabolism